MTARNFGLYFQERIERWGDKTALMWRGEEGWEEISWRMLGDRVQEVALGLIAAGLEPGETVCLLSENRPEWVYADLGIVGAGGINVPIYATNTPEQCAYIIKDSEARFIFCSTAEQLEKIRQVSGELTRLKEIYVFDPPGERLRERERSLADLQEGGRVADPAPIRQRMEGAGPDDTLTLIYTSGTTGEPKGVMLTHGNILSNVEACAQCLPIGPDDVSLSFLPLSHSFERTAGYYTMLSVGATIAYAESLEKLVENLAEVRPTVMPAVPRFYEKLYARIQEGVAQGPPLRRKVFHWAVRVGEAMGRAQQEGLPVPLGLRLKHRLADRLVFQKFAQRLGGRLRFFASGGAPLSREIAEFFYAAGILILEGYGLTETSPVISVNRTDHFKFGTVGPPVPGVTVRIAEDGEILVKGPNVMKGYFKRPEATAEMIDSEGWLHTGDIGELDEENFLKITDRKKDLIVTAAGKNIAPQQIENRLKMDPLIEQVCVVGDRRAFLVALCSPNFEALESWAREAGVELADRQALVRKPRVQETLDERVEAVNTRLARYETIKRAVFVPEVWSQESGELTPTLKVKRRVVEQRYAELIERLYEEAREQYEAMREGELH